MMINKIFCSLVIISLLAVSNFLKSNLNAQDTTLYPEIPRIDVHTHVASDLKAIENYLKLRDQIKEKHHIEFAMWINLGKGDKEITNLSEVLSTAQGRMLACISDYSSHDGLKYAPEELQDWLDKGFIGYKIWAGPYYRRLKEGEKGFRYIDDPAHEATFSKMEEIGMIGASIHIADPNGPWGQRGKWLADPIEYWKEITAWRHVLEKHPKLVSVMAHSNWLVCQDAQLDYLRNMLATFPNLYIDLAATFQYFPLVKRGNLRSFMIEWADRIMFATDIGGWETDEETANHVQRYFQAFQILETDQLVKGSFFGDQVVEGLSLPREVLEKIYYRNAMKVYPGVKEAMINLGYNVN
jgi:predicted TIM-barrel fold metal-dependent hydrolase